MNQRRQAKRRFGLAVLFVVSTMFFSCGGGGTSSPPPASANATFFVTDAAADNILAFSVDVTAASLVDSAGHSVTAAGMPRHLELRHLELAPAIMFQANLPTGNYTALNLTVANVEIVTAGLGGSVKTFNDFTSPNVIISKASLTLPISVTVAANAVGVMADFDLRSSLTNDSSGNYVFSPVVHATQIVGSDSGWQLAGARGEISNVNGTSFTLQLFDGGFTIPVQTKSSTTFSSDLHGSSGLSAGQAVEISAHFANGTFTADSVDSDTNPATSKRGIVVGGPTAEGTPVTIVVQD